jgi:hypothetical protein
MMCWLGFSPTGCTPIRIAMTLLDVSGHLSMLLSHSMSCCIDDMD